MVNVAWPEAFVVAVVGLTSTPSVSAFAWTGASGMPVPVSFKAVMVNLMGCPATTVCGAKAVVNFATGSGVMLIVMLP